MTKQARKHSSMSTGYFPAFRLSGFPAGTTLIEVLIGMTILVIVSTSLYLAYSNVIDIVSAGQYNSAAANLIESEIEIIRNMNYDDIGTSGGIPTGRLDAEKIVILDSIEFNVKTFVRSIDDPFDGILGGTPNDTAPTDYKLVEIQVECNTCPRFGLIRFTTTIAPRNLESSDGSGNLFVKVLDANGIALSGADVTIVNNSVSPTINLTDITGANGQLQLVGVPTSSAGYEVTVTKIGYSTEKTYPQNDPSNPNPIKPHITVAKEQLTVSTFSIDLKSSMTVRTIDQLCSPVANVDLLLTGSKLIGTSPNIPKYSIGHTTDSSGKALVPNLEWDSYSVVSTDMNYEIAGTSSSSPVILNPNTSVGVDWLVIPKNISALLVSIRDDQGNPVNNVFVHLEGTNYDTTLKSGLYKLEETDWTSGRYSNQSGNIYTETAGILTLAPNGGPFATSSYEWLDSKTIDFGTSDTTFSVFLFNPTNQPPETGQDSARIQLATNNDNSTWNYIGPDGTSNSYFTTASASMPTSLSGNQYLRYRVEMQTLDKFITPSVEDIAIEYSSGCLPSGAAHFNGLSIGTYTITATKSGFQDYTDNAVDINADWQEYNVLISP